MKKKILERRLNSKLNIDFSMMPLYMIVLHFFKLYKELDRYLIRRLF